MTHTPPPDDARVTRAWTAFARYDASLTPSPALDRRMLAAGVAAGLVAALVGARWARPVGPVASPPVSAVTASAAPALVPLPSAIVAVAAAAAAPARERRPAPPRSRPAAAPAAGEPRGVEVDGPWQVIRVRVPASALDAFGVQLAGPALAGLVDVDLVVGADGWPRDVRRIRPVPAIDRPE